MTDIEIIVLGVLFTWMMLALLLLVARRIDRGDDR